MAYYIRECRICGAAFKGGPRAWFCPACSAIRKKEQKKIYNQRAKDHTTRQIGSFDTCANCGEKYVVASGIQKYCEKCAPEMLKEIDRKQSLSYYYENKEEINPRRNERRRVPARRCAICGKDFEAIGQKKYCSKECADAVLKPMMANVYEKRRQLKKKEEQNK